MGCVGPAAGRRTVNADGLLRRLQKQRSLTTFLGGLAQAGARSPLVTSSRSPLSPLLLSQPLWCFVSVSLLMGGGVGCLKETTMLLFL